MASKRKRVRGSKHRPRAVAKLSAKHSLLKFMRKNDIPRTPVGSVLDYLAGVHTPSDYRARLRMFKGRESGY